MENKVRLTIEKYGMLSNGDSILVALSGGADSMTLLRLICVLKDKYNLKIAAAHVNHGIRAGEAVRDETAVKNYCDKNNIPIYIKHADIPALSKKNHIGEEECGRAVRYEFFDECINSYLPNGKIATAHNLDDSIETVLLNMTRGTALSGLCGIKPVRGNIIRPLCECTKAEILNYCKTNSLPYVTDSTNDQDMYRRNFIRHNVTPLFFNLNPSFDTAAARMIKSLSRDDIFLNGLAQKGLISAKTGDNKYSASILRTLDDAVLTRTLSLAAQNAGAGVSFESIDALSGLLKNGGKINMPGNIFAHCDGQSLCFFTETAPDLPYEAAVKTGENKFFEKIIKIEEINNPDACKNVYNLLLCNLISCDKIVGNMILRNRRAGDKITLKGRCTKTLKRLFNESKIPPSQRERVALICDDKGVLWVEGFGTDARAAYNGTGNFIKVEVDNEF